MNIFKRFFNFLSRRLKTKYLVKEQGRLSFSLKYFKIIDYSDKYKKTRERLSTIKSCREVLKKAEVLDDLIQAHNENVDRIDKTLKTYLKNDPISSIVSNIEKYDLEKLSKMNEVALEFKEYTIPKSFEQKNKFLDYILKLGKLIDDYKNVSKQNVLIKEYREIIDNLEDKYFDRRESERVIGLLKTKLQEIRALGEQYYKTPILDSKIIDIHNANFIQNHICDNIFDDINGRSLDNEQRRAVLCDSKSNLVIAGAGAGKTLTICGKVKWLLEEMKVKPKDILLMSYSKASADDLYQKVKNIDPDLDVKTFHSLGLDILNVTNGCKKAVEDQFKHYIDKYFDEVFTIDPQIGQCIFEFLTLYLYSNSVDDKQYEDDGKRFEDLKKLEYKTLKDRLASSEKISGKYETIQKEFVKSYQELVIANWLFINGINYEYEKSYKYGTSTLDKRQYTPDFYLPDYDIYIEHYGINKQNRTPQYSKEEEVKYLDGIAWKRQIHAKYNTTCIETYSYYFSDESIFKKLQEKLEEHGVKIKPLSKEEISNSVNDLFLGQERTSLFNLVMTFISLYKAQYPNESYFDGLLQTDFQSDYDKERAKHFIRICKAIYLFYIKEIRNQDKIDFDDMILQAINALDSTNKYKYKYIIVDEFQDISQSRKKFLDRLIQQGDSKLFAVGDDWQAIYRFAGCDINIFLNFKNLFEDAKLNYITTTHRNSSELQTIVEPFITSNPEQYKKHITSAKHQEKPIRIIYHKNNRKAAFLEALKKISERDKKAKVLVLGRNRRDVDCMISDDVEVKDYNNIICKNFADMDITYKTVHQSKGLESDYVILISGEDAKNGFPNKMEDDALLELVLSGKSLFQYAEERRLFYVALTRTRSLVYILSDKSNKSEFVREIEVRSSIENPELIKDDELTDKFLCPWCKSGKLIIRDNTDNNTQFYGCSNYPYCQYTINDLRAVKTNNRCPACGDLLILRKGKNGNFIGCHNYPRCKYTKSLKENLY